jgi:DNA-binding NarL/FixJ family response regulator
MPPSAALATLNVMPREKDPLTETEIEVINLIVRGFNDEEINSCSKVDGIELEPIITSIYSKLGVSDRLELIIHAIYHGITVSRF